MASAFVAVSFAVGGCSDSTGPEYVARVALEPDSAHLEPGESVSFTAVPLGPEDQRYPDRAGRVDWSLALNPDLVDFEIGENGVTVTAREVGTARVEAALGRGLGEAPVYIRPPGLASIEIEPAEIELRRFTAVQARAILRDASGARISPEGHRVSWEADNSDVLFIVTNTANTPFATVSGRQVGNTTLRLVVGPFRASARVTVLPR